MSDLIARLKDAERLCEDWSFFGSQRAINDAIKRIAELEAENARLRVDSNALGGFVGEIINRDNGDLYDIDGGDIQDLAVKYGLFQEVEVTESCGEFCVCEDFPTRCYRYTYLGKAAIDAAMKAEAKRQAAGMNDILKVPDIAGKL